MVERIICGDNLEVLKSLEDEVADLIYIDPPFFTSRDYEIIWKDGAEVRAFEDRWVKEGDGKYSKDINVYLNFMEPRIKELYRVLKKTGSFYLHCDYHADAYLRILCDQIFGYDNLQNRICWKRTNGKGTAKNKFPVNHDVILFYTKSNNFTFNPQRMASNIDKKLIKYDEIGEYRLHEIIRKSRSTKGKTRIIEGKEITLDDTHGWLWSQERIDKYTADGYKFEWSSKGNPYYKQYKHEGSQCDDIWLDMFLDPSSKERLGYPTQKPEALLERIINASSNEGYLILDVFCGCGTTLAVAKRLKRQFIGVDVSPTACRLMANRIKLPLKDVEGMALTSDEITELSGYEFQNYIIHLLTFDKSKVTVNNRGADGGIDGFFFDELISVKKYKAGRKDLDEFVATIYRNKKKLGIFLALDYTGDFIKEVARLLREDNIIILYFTIEQLINKEHEQELVKYRKDISKYF